MCRHTLHRTFVHRATVSNSPMAAKDTTTVPRSLRSGPREPMFFWFRTGVFSATSHVDEERLRPISVSGGDYPADNGGRPRPNDQRQMGDRSAHPMPQRLPPRRQPRSSSATSPALGTAVADIRVGIAAPVTRWCTGRRSTPTATPLMGRRSYVSQTPRCSRRHLRPVIRLGGGPIHVSGDSISPNL